jgi:hypothetical protein
MMTAAEYRLRAKTARQRADLAVDPKVRFQLNLIVGHWVALATVGAAQEAMDIGPRPWAWGDSITLH